MTVLSDAEILLAAAKGVRYVEPFDDAQPNSIDLHLGDKLLRLAPPESSVQIPLRARDGAIIAYATVDAADAEWVNQWHWALTGTGYAIRGSREGGRKRNVRLHRELLGLTEVDRVEVDHINRNRLDCRRSNLRIVTHQGNMQNRNSNSNTSSIYRGVTWHKQRGKWAARIKVEGRTKHLGLFSDEIEAAEAAQAARSELFPWSAEHPNATLGQGPILDPEADQSALWQDVPLRADGRWLLGQGTFYLGATAETLTIPRDIAGFLHGVSSIGRLGLLVHVTAGVIDSEYTGRPTLEIFPLAGPIYLRPGQRIAQVTLHRLGLPVLAGYAGRYQGATEPEPSRAHLDAGAPQPKEVPA